MKLERSGGGEGTRVRQGDSGSAEIRSPEATESRHFVLIQSLSDDTVSEGGRSKTRKTQKEQACFL